MGSVWFESSPRSLAEIGANLTRFAPSLCTATVEGVTQRLLLLRRHGLPWDPNHTTKELRVRASASSALD